MAVDPNKKRRKSVSKTYPTPTKKVVKKTITKGAKVSKTKQKTVENYPSGREVTKVVRRYGMNPITKKVTKSKSPYQKKVTRSKAKL